MLLRKILIYPEANHGCFGVTPVPKDPHAVSVGPGLMPSERAMSLPNRRVTGGRLTSTQDFNFLRR